MTDLWRQAITSAEGALRGSSADRQRLEAVTAELRGDAQLPHRPGLGKDVAYLSALLEALGLAKEARALLEHVASRVMFDPEALSLPMEVRNELAVALADRGELSAAITILSTAVVQGTHDLADRSPDGVEARTLANLAALKLRLGDLTGARNAARQVDLGPDAPDSASPDHLETRLLTESVLVEVARRQGDDTSADELVNTLALTARRLVRHRGPDHPASLSALITLARAEFASALAAGDQERLERSADVLDIAAQKASATLGPHHPLAQSALFNLALAELDAPHATGGQGHVEEAEALLQARQRLTPPPATHAPAVPEDGSVAFVRTPLRLPDSARRLRKLPAVVRLHCRTDLEEVAAAMRRAQVDAETFAHVLAGTVVLDRPDPRVLKRELLREFVQDLVRDRAVALDPGLVRNQGLVRVLEHGRSLGRAQSTVRNLSLDLAEKLLEAVKVSRDRIRARVLDLASDLVRALDRDLALELALTLDADLASDLVRVFDGVLDLDHVLDLTRDLDLDVVLDRIRVRSLDLAQALADAQQEFEELASSFEGADLEYADNLGTARLGGLRWNEQTRWPTWLAGRIRRSSHEASPGVFVVDPAWSGEAARSPGAGM
ncbi:hypothetical protein [Streptomyces sp. HUAS ZL42]|uniref:hypothetical protein n=1 Tax=Streptomyces sp. HUAS ZL42 TaxID=3231715 RepID=UPI00345E73E5